MFFRKLLLMFLLVLVAAMTLSSAEAATNGNKINKDKNRARTLAVEEDGESFDAEAWDMEDSSSGGSSGSRERDLGKTKKKTKYNKKHCYYYKKKYKYYYKYYQDYCYAYD